jgi:hypothetical protein
MTRTLVAPATRGVPTVRSICFLITALLIAGPALAQRPDHDRYHTPHWVLDDRYHHNHYYPALGYAVPALPAGYLVVNHGGARFFFHAGVWFQGAGPGFVVVRPPVGVLVPVLPPAYTSVWIGGMPYFYANDVYYSAAPGGYAVAQPPPAAAPVAQAPPPPQAAPAPGGAPSATWYFCESSKAYYPYVAECKEGWRAVPATPPPPSR